MSERFMFTGDDLGAAYSAAVDAILDGQLVVFPTDTVYGVAADAFKPDAVQRLLDAKGRGRDMPPPVLISAAETLDALATSVSESGRKLCETFWPGALTVICHAQSSLMWDLGDTKGTVALRVPDHESTRELLSRTGPLAVSSANVSGKPAAMDVYDAERQLGETVQVYLDGGPLADGADTALPSTIVDLTGDVPRVIRMGAIDIDQLREVVPDLEAPDDNPPPPPEDEPPSDQPTEIPADDVTDTPADDVTDTPADDVTDTPAEEVTEASAEDVTGASAGEATEAPAEAGTEAGAADASDTPAEDGTEAAPAQASDVQAEGGTEAGAAGASGVRDEKAADDGDGAKS